MPEPFLKWPGGKRWLTQGHRGMFPSEFGRYYEPFLGGGAVFFFLSPKRSTLSDANGELLNVYACIKKNVAAVHRGLKDLHALHSSELYYRIREASPTDPVEKAVRFLYLNRTCFNGIYRVNLRGVFNVPMGSKTQVEYPLAYLTEIAERLGAASLHSWDFEKSIDKARGGDFVFVDPPYTVMHNNNNFVKYNAPLFSWSDQVRLAAAVKRAGERGALVMVSNADHKSIRELYAGFGSHHSVSRASVLAADPSSRRQTTELLIVNYAVPVSPLKARG